VTRAKAIGVEPGLLLVATLVARLAKKLAVLLLRHALAALLDDGTHGTYLELDDSVVASARWTRQTVH